MHPALLIPKVVQRIMEHLHPSTVYLNNPKKKQKATLVNAALTCSSFSGPALDILWHTMDDLIPLFKLLPNFELSVDKAVPSNIWGRIPEDNISTFNAYAKRIKDYEPKIVNNIHISAYNCILRSCGRSYLLPNLTHFKSIKPFPDEVLFLLSPCLQELFAPRPPFVFQGPRDNPGIFLNSLQSQSPNLLILKLQYVVLDNRCLVAFCHLPRLEALILQEASSETESITLDFLLDMSARHTLHRLELEGDDLKIVPGSKPCFNHDPVVFSALKHIAIKCALAMESITILLRKTTFPVLRTFKIGLRGTLLECHRLGMQEQWQQFFSTIGHATTDCFKVLEITGSSNKSSVGLHLSNLPKLGSLFLESFAVGGPLLSLNQADVRAIVHAWPRLTDLSLPHCNESPEVEFSILITIARGLPQLKYLALSIDTTVRPDLKEIPLLSHGLQSLTLTNSPVDDVKLVVQSLDRLFPKLQVWHFVGHCSELWEEASSLLKIVHRVRRDDAMRRATSLALGMSEDLGRGIKKSDKETL